MTPADILQLSHLGGLLHATLDSTEKALVRAGIARRYAVLETIKGSTFVRYLGPKMCPGGNCHD